MGNNSNESSDSTSSSDHVEARKQQSHHHRHQHHGKHKSEKKKHKRKSSKKSKKHEHRRSSSSRKEKRKLIDVPRATSAEEEHPSPANRQEAEETFGPALPPHLLKTATNKPIIGPEMPRNAEDLERLQKSREQDTLANVDAAADNSESEEIDSAVYGPLPPGHNSDAQSSHSLELSGNHLLLEERALELKMAAIDGCFPVQGQQRDIHEREEWMMELPEVGLKRNVRSNGATDILNLLKRGFHQGKEKPDFEDRSEWTKTPGGGDGSKAKRSAKAQSPTAALKKEALETEARRRDLEQEVLAKKYRRRDKDGKREKAEETLFEQHQRRLREEEEERRKRPPEKVERRPFNRDIDLKLVKIDRNQTKQIVKNAKLLDSKFSSGQTKYL